MQLNDSLVGMVASLRIATGRETGQSPASPLSHTVSERQSQLTIIVLVIRRCSVQYPIRKSISLATEVATLIILDICLI